MAADAGVLAPAQGVREDMLPGPAAVGAVYGGRGGGYRRAGTKKAGTVPLPCPLCRHGSSNRAHLAPQQRLEPSVGPPVVVVPTEGNDENFGELAQPNLNGACVSCRRVRAGGAVTMPTLRYQCMRRMAGDVKPNCRAVFVPAVMAVDDHSWLAGDMGRRASAARATGGAIGGRSRGAGSRGWWAKAGVGPRAPRRWCGPSVALEIGGFAGIRGIRGDLVAVSSCFGTCPGGQPGAR
jgi:hypothetical protein